MALGGGKFGKHDEVLPGSYINFTKNKYLRVVDESANDDSTLVIPVGTTTIEAKAYQNNTNLVTVIIPDSVTSIGDYAFDGCTNLTNVIMSARLETIGRYAFQNCTGITSIYLPLGLTTIGNSTFRDCKNLESVVIPKSVTTIEAYAFYNCRKLANVYITDLEAWCSIEFNNWGHPLKEGGATLYLNKSPIDDLIIPEPIENVAPYTFYGVNGLKRVTFADSVTTIGHNSFNMCKHLQYVIIGRGVTSIGSNAFRTNQYALTIDLTRCVEFPTIGTNALWCGGGLFIHVASGRKDELAAMENWSTYADRIVEVDINE